MPAKKKSTAVVSWQEAMKEAAQEMAHREQSTGGGGFFSMRAGQLAYGDVAMPGNMMACVILDAIFETVYYEGPFDPDNPQGPTAFALGRDQKELRWNEEYSDPEYAGKLCSESDICQWGSASQGRGKAAKETRRLAVIPAGTYISQGKGKGFELELFDDPDDFRNSEIAYTKLPVTSVKNFSQYVRGLNDQMGAPTWRVITDISLEAHPQYQFQVNFELIEELPDDVMPVIFERVEEAKEAIMFPYVPRDDEPAPAKPASNKKLTRGRK